jgi:O-antigen ligase
MTTDAAPGGPRNARHRTLDDRLAIAFGASLLIFLVVGDAWFPTGSPWHRLRLPALGAVVLTAGLLAVRRPAPLRLLVRPPMVFFVAFSIVALAVAPLADGPRSALRYALGYLVMAAVCGIAAGVFAPRTLARGALASLLVKVGMSLAIAALPIAWWEPGPRFRGMLGNPNPMGTTAGLAYLLLMLHGWYDRRTPWGRWFVVFAAVVATGTLAAAHSVSATVTTTGALLVTAPLGSTRGEGWRRRLAWFALAVAILVVPLLLVDSDGTSAVAGARSSPAASALQARVAWWGMLGPAVLERPWVGYGAGATSTLVIEGRPPWATSAHNLYLEAALYAGIPAAFAMLLFVAGGLLASLRLAVRARDGISASFAAVVVFYAVLSLVEPVVLNGAPSSLVMPLVAVAACTWNGRTPEGRR